MPDNREKVISGLQRCRLMNKVNCDKCPYDYNGRGNGKSECTAELADDVLALLKEQEAKKGKWIEKIDYMGDSYYDCSVCNESWMTIEGTPWVNGMNYCPHCGAKMKFEGR